MAGTYQCFHCLNQKVIWDGDFDFEDYGLEGNGIIHELHCCSCGARIQYQIPIGKEDELDGDTE